MSTIIGHPTTVLPTTRNLTSSPDIYPDFRELLGGVGLDPKDTGGEVTFTGADPILPSRHRLGAIMAMGMMGPAVATQILYTMRGGPAQDLSVDLRKAVAHINPLFLFRPTAGGYPLHSPLLTPSNAMAFNIYPTRDDRWYLPTAVYPRMWLDWAGRSERAGRQVYFARHLPVERRRPGERGGRARHGRCDVPHAGGMVCPPSG